MQFYFVKKLGVSLFYLYLRKLNPLGALCSVYCAHGVIPVQAETDKTTTLENTLINPTGGHSNSLIPPASISITKKIRA